MSETTEPAGNAWEKWPACRGLVGGVHGYGPDLMWLQENCPSCCRWAAGEEYARMLLYVRSPPEWDWCTTGGLWAFAREWRQDTRTWGGEPQPFADLTYLAREWRWILTTPEAEVRAAYEAWQTTRALAGTVDPQLVRGA